MGNSGGKKLYTAEEYLEMEEQAGYKSEFYDGEIYAMSGGTLDHGTIIANVVRELGNALMDSSCRVVGSEVKVRENTANAFMYPDSMVICGPTVYEQGRKDVVKNPSVVVEVLSNSTAGWDRGGKFARYGQLPSVQEYVLIEQEEARVDVFRRMERNEWKLRQYSGLEGEIFLESLGISIPLKGIYHMIELSDPTGPNPG